MARKRKKDSSSLIALGLAVAAGGYFLLSAVLSKASGDIKETVKDAAKEAEDVMKKVTIKTEHKIDVVSPIAEFFESSSAAALRLRLGTETAKREQRIIDLYDQAREKGYVRTDQLSQLNRDLAVNDSYIKIGNSNAVMNPKIVALAETIKNKLKGSHLAIIYENDIPYAKQIVLAEKVGGIDELKLNYMHTDMTHNVGKNLSRKTADEIQKFIDRKVKTGAVKIKVSPQYGTGFMSWKEWYETHVED